MEERQAQARRVVQIKNSEGWAGKVPVERQDLVNSEKERKGVRKEDDSEVCSSRDWKTNDAIIRHRDVRKKS